jgi:hypothetical protein
MTGIAPRRVSPFGHPRITGCVPLPLAYRSLPRPSSPPCAQASPTGLLSLDHKNRQAQHAQETLHSVSTYVRSVQSPSLVRRRRRLASLPPRPMRIRFPRGPPHRCGRPLLDPSLVNQHRVAQLVAERRGELTIVPDSTVKVNSWSPRRFVGGATGASRRV